MSTPENYEIFTSRPADARSAVEQSCYELLERLNIDYRRIDHESIDTIEGCEWVERALGIKICKNLFLTNSKRDRLYLLIMPGEKQLVTRELSKKIGSTRLSFATAENMLKYLGVTPGSVSILGLMNDTEGDVTLLVDRDLLADKYFGCHPCKNTTSLSIKTDDLFKKIIPALGHEPTFVEL